MDTVELDRVLNNHYMYEATDDVPGVVSTVTDDVKHYVTGSPLGELTGKESAGAFYAELFKDFQGEGVEQVARWHGHNFVVDEIIWTGHIDDARLFGLPGRTGHASFRLLHVIEFRDGKISRENVWPDTAAILAQTHEATSAQYSQRDG
ncbi:MAG TPA: ester cyclase [Microlunatus sp.]